METDVLDLLGIDLGSTEMQVLTAVLLLSERDRRTVTVDNIFREVTRRNKAKISKNWIYKSLKRLVEEGFVGIDKVRQPHLYYSSLRHLNRGLHHRLKSQLEIRSAELERLERDLDLLSQIDCEVVYSHLTQAAGLPRQRRGFVLLRNQDEISAAMIENILLTAGPGETVWHIAPVPLLPNSGGGIIQLQKAAQTTLERRTRLHVLIVPQNKVGKATSVDIRNVIDAIRTRIATPLREGLVVRVDTSGEAKPLAIGIDRSRALLILDDTYPPQVGVLALAPHQQAFIDDLLSVFEAAWENAVQMIPPQSED